MSPETALGTGRIARSAAIVGGLRRALGERGIRFVGASTGSGANLGRPLGSAAERPHHGSPRLVDHARVGRDDAARRSAHGERGGDCLGPRVRTECGEQSTSSGGASATDDRRPRGRSP